MTPYRNLKINQANTTSPRALPSTSRGTASYIGSTYHRRSTLIATQEHIEHNNKGGYQQEASRDTTVSSSSRVRLASSLSKEAQIRIATLLRVLGGVYCLDGLNEQRLPRPKTPKGLITDYGMHCFYFLFRLMPQRVRVERSTPTISAISFFFTPCKCNSSACFLFSVLSPHLCVTRSR